MEKHQGFSQNNITEHYNELASHYEDVYLKVGWPDPRKSADFVIQLQPTYGKEKVEVLVLDMGCGTGLVGQYLKEAGFTNIHGQDASAKMLEQAKDKEAYSDLQELFLGKPDTYPERYHNKYDFITASGILADNHLDTSVFEEMLLSLKQGGIAIFTSRTEYLEAYGYAPYMNKLEEDGKWKFVQKEPYIKYNNLNEGVGRFKPTESYVFAYQKL